jgi:hypothetical protein
MKKADDDVEQHPAAMQQLAERNDSEINELVKDAGTSDPWLQQHRKHDWVDKAKQRVSRKLFAKQTRESRKAWIHALRRTIQDIESEQREVESSGEYTWYYNNEKHNHVNSQSNRSNCTTKRDTNRSTSGSSSLNQSSCQMNKVVAPVSCQVTVNERFVEQPTFDMSSTSSALAQSANAASELWRSLKKETESEHERMSNTSSSSNDQHHHCRAKKGATSKLPQHRHRYNDPLDLPMAPFLVYHARHSHRKSPESGAAMPCNCSPDPATSPSIFREEASIFSNERLRYPATVVPSKLAINCGRTSTIHSPKGGSLGGVVTSSGRSTGPHRIYQRHASSYNGTSMCGVLSDQHLLHRVRLSSSLRIKNKLQVCMYTQR